MGQAVVTGIPSCESLRIIRVRPAARIPGAGQEQGAARILRSRSSSFRCTDRELATVRCRPSSLDCRPSVPEGSSGDCTVRSERIQPAGPLQAGVAEMEPLR